MGRNSFLLILRAVQMRHLRYDEGFAVCDYSLILRTSHLRHFGLVKYTGKKMMYRLRPIYVFLKSAYFRCKELKL